MFDINECGYIYKIREMFVVSKSKKKKKKKKKKSIIVSLFYVELNDVYIVI